MFTEKYFFLFFITAFSFCLSPYMAVVTNVISSEEEGKQQKQQTFELISKKTVSKLK